MIVTDKFAGFAKKLIYFCARPQLLLPTLLALLPFLFFWRLITPVSADRMQITGGDFTGQYFPLRAFAAQEWVNGRVPLWNPYLYGGQPALADIQSGALYPPHILQVLLLGWGGPLLGRETGFPLSALEWQVILHFSLAAVGTFGFARHAARQTGASQQRARFAGVIASVVFTYGGYFTGFPVQQLTILEVSAWLPWVLWGLAMANGRLSESATERMSESASWRGETILTAKPGGSETANQSLPPVPPPRRSPAFLPAAWAALAFAMAILAGHPQTVLYIFYLSLAYSLFLALAPLPLLTPAPLPIQLRRFALHMIPWLITVTLGAALAAAQLLPTVEFIRRSVRADLAYEAVSAGLPLTELAAVLYPGFFGGSPQYVGIAALVLAALALTLRPAGLKASPVRSSPGAKPAYRTSPQPPSPPAPLPFFWAGAALISLLLAFGGHTFLYPLIYLLTPGFEAVRQQERVFLVYSFSMAMLAGYGALALAGPLPAALRPRYAVFGQNLRRVAVIAGVMSAFYVLGSTTAAVRGDEVNLFYGVLWHHLFGLLILAGMLILLALRPRRILRRGWGMALLALWLAFNLFTVNWRFNLEKPTTPAPFEPDGVVLFLQDALRQNPGRIAGGGLLPGGNSAASVFGLRDLTGNTPLQLAAANIFLEQMPSWRLWQLMNVRYVVADRDIGGPGLSPVFAEGIRTVFEMGDPFPPVWAVNQIEVIAPPERAIARLAADDFDLRRAAVVPQPLETALTGNSSATVQLTADSPTRLAARVQAPGAQLLVFSRIYDPGWRVDLNGRAAPLLRVNTALMGVVVPQGEHTVELVYAPASFLWGLVISGIALLVWGAMVQLKMANNKWQITNGK